jgi:hypothetical protein
MGDLLAHLLRLAMRNLRGLVAIILLLPVSAVAERPVKVGELNSYKLLPQYLEPYRKRAGNLPSKK